MKPCFTRLLKCGIHNLLGNALNLDIHLQGGDPCFRTRDFEVHVAQVVFITENVGQHCESIVLEHEPHSHSGHRRLQRDTSIHQGQACATHRCH